MNQADFLGPGGRKIVAGEKHLFRIGQPDNIQQPDNPVGHVDRSQLYRGHPGRTVSEAMRMSQVTASSHPPRRIPLTIATTIRKIPDRCQGHLQGILFFQNFHYLRANGRGKGGMSDPEEKALSPAPATQYSEFHPPS